ncbi:hypothetical protein H2200_009949 [Cladophialophora chaetospira]|uniref:Phosphoribosyltransferase domain-containing protein n=1 Tax=Cladophialophora chaetospira TaxID=386627 RepID=A0AA38X1Y6_9EURO|nr:hypothetical protein H2200_009949 [Cladophialophora chaetospira]
MDAFDQVHILTNMEGGDSGFDSSPLVVAEAGCKTGIIMRKALAAGVTVPLGSRPSVGSGSWLQGGIGHLARLHGLACDAIVGAVMVSVKSGNVFYIGHVPSQHRPAGAIHSDKESDLLWAIKGAGTNFGIVLSVTFKAYSVPTYLIRNWVLPLNDSLEARLKLKEFDEVVATKLPRNCSADAYLYWEASQLHLGVTMFESSAEKLAFATSTSTPTAASTIWGSEADSKVVDSVELFNTELYMSGMHGGHGGGKTSSLKRCLFLERIGTCDVAGRLVAAVMTRPSPLCYLDLLQGGGAISDVAADATAFGCREWDFACVITGVWPRDQDDTATARSAVQWVYKTAADLMPLCKGAYGADLGPDPRDAALAAIAFGPNRSRLAGLKYSLDSCNVLAYACPMPTALMKHKLIILATGEACTGKDFCAGVWVSVFNNCTRKGLAARAISISHAIKKAYAANTALTAFFQEQVRQRPQLAEEQFLNVVNDAVGVDVLLITGMRDEAPVAAFSHLVPDSKLVEVRVQASEQVRRLRCKGDGSEDQINKDGDGSNVVIPESVFSYAPCLVFENNATGDKAVKKFAEKFLLPFVDEDLQKLGDMVRSVPNFPREGIEFRHVHGISQQPGGLSLCTHLLRTHFTGAWTKVDAIACCEAGGFVYASALASQVDVPLVLIREAGKLPPPTVSVAKPSSHISSSNQPEEKRIEMERDVLTRGASVVVVDDVLSTGKTLCAVLQLLEIAGVRAEDVCIMVIVELPMHRGRDLLRRRGFGRTSIRSLLVFGGA